MLLAVGNRIKHLRKPVKKQNIYSDKGTAQLPGITLKSFFQHINFVSEEKYKNYKYFFLQVTKFILSIGMKMILIVFYSSFNII